MLSESERLLLARLSVFAGGWTLEAVELICSEKGLNKADILDVLTGLVDKSLVAGETDTSPERRYSLLETMRGYEASDWNRLETRNGWGAGTAPGTSNWPSKRRKAAGD